MSQQNSYHKNNKTLSRNLRSDFNSTTFENSNNGTDLVIENSEPAIPETETDSDLQNNKANDIHDESTSITTKKFSVLFANTASVETLTYWAKSGILSPFIAELKTFWLGAAKSPFKLRLRAPDPYLSDMKFNSDPADPFLDIHA